VKLTIRKEPEFQPRPELLLHPNVPKPLHGMSPRELLGDAWWDTVRQEAYRKAGYRCQACGVGKLDAKYHKWLEAHETYIYDYRTGTATVDEIVALCHSCHNYIHSGRLRALFQAGKTTKAKYEDIRIHGDNLLSAHNLTFPESPTETAPWHEWKIVINGKIFPTKWKSFEEWNAHYNGN
jgi:hypothetical protein